MQQTLKAAEIETRPCSNSSSSGEQHQQQKEQQQQQLPEGNALSNKALGAIEGVGELLREEEQRRREVDESIRTLCLRSGDRVFASLKLLEAAKGHIKRVLRELDTRRCGKKKAHIRAHLAFECLANALFPGWRAVPSQRHDFSAVPSPSGGARHQKVLTLTSIEQERALCSITVVDIMDH